MRRLSPRLELLLPLTVHRDSAKLGRPPLVLHDPSPTVAGRCTKVAVGDAAVLVRDPRLASAGREVKVGDKHVLILERKELGGCERVEVELAKGAVVRRRDELGVRFDLFGLLSDEAGMKEISHR